MKTCSRCRESKPTEAFGKNRTNRDGLASWCRVCRKETDADHRRRNSKRINAQIAEYRKANPERTRAHWGLRNALRRGHLTRPTSCSECGKECKPQGHHPDYSKHREVVWLCAACHRNLHVKEAQNEQ